MTKFPTVRQIARNAAAQNNRMSALIMGVVNSPAFQMSVVEATTSPGDERRAADKDDRRTRIDRRHR